MKVLVIAPVCDRDDVGEAWVGYQWVKHVASLNDVTVLGFHRKDHTTVAEQLPGVRVVEWMEPGWFGRAERFNAMLKPSYFVYYWKARRWMRRALPHETYDVVYQPVPVAMRYPSPGTGLGIPLVLGPVGGGLESPVEFEREEDTTPWFVRLRRFDQLRLRFDPMLRRTYRRAACVVGIGPYVADLLEHVPMQRFEIMPETAIEALPDLPKRDRPADQPLRLLFVGRVIRTKGVRDAVRALALVADRRTTLDIVGDGPDRSRCEELARDLGVDDRVTFHGRVPRAQVDEFYRQADVFVFPSYREPGGNVQLEAMAQGLPLVVCDRGGPATSVDATCAIAVPAISPEQLARDVAAAIDTLADDPGRRLAMGVAARARIEREGLWRHRAERITEIFRSVVA